MMPAFTDWRDVRLESIAETFSGGTPSRANPAFYGGGIPWVKSGEVNQRFVRSAEETISAAALENSSARIAPSGSVLVAMYGATAGKVARLEIEAAINQAILAILPQPNQVDGGFLFYALEAETPAILRKVQGSGQPNLSGSILRQHGLSLPPVPEQRKIAAILSSIDAAIEATQVVIDQLHVVKKAMMAELLTRGLPGRHTRFKQTEIGEVPEGWEILRLDQLVANGPSNGRSPPSRTTPPGVPSFSIAAVRNGRVNIRDNLKYTDISTDEVAKFFVESDDILIVRGNGNPSLVGKCGLVANPPAGCIYPDILMRIRLRPATLAPGFFVSIWNSDLIHQQILDRAKTTNGTYKINGEDVRSILLPVPNPEEQRLLSTALASLDDNYEIYEEKLVGLNSVKSALSSALLTGEIRVQPDEATP